MNENPNSLIIYIPLCLNEEINLHDDFEFSSLVSYAFRGIFKKIEKCSLMKIVPINRGDVRLKKYLHRTILPNKVNISLEFFHIESRSKKKQDNFYFFRVEIYSSNTEVIYINFINYYYDNKIDILSFLLALFKLGNLKSDFMIKLIKKNVKNNDFIYFNIIYFRPIEEQKIKNIKNIYLTEENIRSTNKFEIYSDLQGRLSLFFSKNVTHRSGSNLRLIGLRAFLLRYFTWIYQKGNEEFSNLLYDIFNFSDYLILHTRYRQIYRAFIRLRNFNLAYGDDLFRDDYINVLKESEKTWKRLTHILNFELDLKSIPREVFNNENDFNEYLCNKIKKKLPNIRLNRRGAGFHVDLSVGNQVAIEVKKIKKKNRFDELFGQIEEDLRILGINYGIAYGIDYTKKKLYLRHNTHKFGTQANIIYIMKPYPYL